MKRGNVKASEKDYQTSLPKYLLPGYTAWPILSGVGSGEGREYFGM
jgi:hypothetical protein